MTDRDTENRIIELRARGKSYSTIASELKIGKQTALDVCKKYKEQIATLQALELEQLYEEQRITSTERITAIASLMQRVREEIDSRDLSQVPTEKLIDLYLKQASALKEEIIEPNFQSSEEQSRDRKEREYLDRLTATP
jgi:orotate phosphoribosyltransferase-like protein